MFEIYINQKFEAAHFLPGYKGKCANLHGHTWRFELTIRSEFITDGMVMDFIEVKEALNEVLPDHTLLNDIIPNPTAENLSAYLYKQMKERITGLVKVVVWESENLGAAFLKVNEIFYSVQGEGKNSGIPMVFVRLAGCNLRCDFCDTKYAVRGREGDDGRGDSIRKGEVPLKVGLHNRRRAVHSTSGRIGQAAEGGWFSDSDRDKRNDIPARYMRLAGSESQERAEAC